MLLASNDASIFFSFSSFDVPEPWQTAWRVAQKGPADNNNTCTVSSSCNRINTWTVSTSKYERNFLRFNQTFSTLWIDGNSFSGCGMHAISDFPSAGTNSRKMLDISRRQGENEAGGDDEVAKLNVNEVKNLRRWHLFKWKIAVTIASIPPSHRSRFILQSRARSSNPCKEQQTRIFQSKSPHAFSPLRINYSCSHAAQHCYFSCFNWQIFSFSFVFLSTPEKVAKNLFVCHVIPRRFPRRADF